MSRFRILQINDPDPESLGKRNRFLYTVYGIIPTLFVLSVNLATIHSKNSGVIFLISLPVVILILIFLLRKIRSEISHLKTIGEIEITQSCLKKRLGDAVTEYAYQSVKELSLNKHIPATRLRESKSGYFSYILRILMTDGSEESMVVSDRSSDLSSKLSITETMKTLKKIVPFEVIINT